MNYLIYVITDPDSCDLADAGAEVKDLEVVDEVFMASIAT